MHSIGSFWPWRSLVLEGEVEVARDVFEFVEGRLAREALEQVSGRLVVLVVFCDEPFERELGDAGAEAVTVGVVSQANWASFQNGTTESPGDVAEVVPELVEGLPLDERVDVPGLGGLVECSVEFLAHVGSGGVVDDGYLVGLQLDAAVALLDVAGRANDFAELDVGVRAHAGLLEGGTRDDAGAVADLEDGRAAGLVDLEHLAGDDDGLAGHPLEVGDVGLVAVGAVLGLVLGDFDFVEADVAVLADLAEFHDEFVADVGVRVEIRRVDEPGDGPGEVDEDAVLHDAVDGSEVQFTLLDVVEGTAIGEFVDDGFRLGSLCTVSGAGGRRHLTVLRRYRVLCFGLVRRVSIP